MLDFLIVGAGLYGATFARLATDAGYKCLVIEKRNHVGGNCHTEIQDGIMCAKHGGHIFHTNSKWIWNFVHRFAEFRPYIHHVLGNIDNERYSLPLNMFTFQKMFGINTPDEAHDLIKSLRSKIYQPANLEEWCLSQVGEGLYEKFFKGYTEKQWGRSAKELPASIIRRLPIRFTYDARWFDDTYQGVPIGGYTAMVEKMLEGIDVKLDTEYLPGYDTHWTVYTGCIDDHFNNVLGKLEYRSLKHADTFLAVVPDFLGCGTMNECSPDVPATRIIEHKHFWGENQPHTIITREYPSEVGEPYYPIPTERNIKLYERYAQQARLLVPKTIFGGRLGRYQYFNMDQTIAAAHTAFQIIAL